MTGSIAAYKAVELLRLLRAEGADVAVHAHPVRDAVRRAAVVRGAVAPPGRDRPPRAAARRPDRPHRRRRHGRRDRRRAGDRALAGRDGQRAGRRRRDRDLPRDVGARSSSRRRWTATCGRIRRRGANVARLRDDFGYTIVEPEAGPLASGQSGVGRLAELPAIVDAVVAAVGDRPVRAAGRRRRARRSSSRPRDADLAGRHIVVTAGGTREAIDPVRFIGNRSTGKMGVAIAEAALDRGARVTLIAGERRGRRCPPAPTVVRVESTADLRAALLRATHAADGAAGFDALVMAAAVADFRPADAGRDASSSAATG